VRSIVILGCFVLERSKTHGQAFGTAGWQLSGNARAKGKKLGRPRKIVDGATVTALRARGLARRAISEQLGVGVATLYRVAQRRSKTQEKATRMQGVVVLL
jgi:hypothetical protein